MPDKPADASVAARIELAVGKLDSLSILPSTAARLLSEMNKFALTPQSLHGLVSSDPVLSATVLTLCQRDRQGPLDPADPVRSALDRLSLRSIRDAILSLNVYQLSQPDAPKLAARKELTRHTIAVACCAGKVAELLSPSLEPQSAYTAGLLHDIGKFALDDAMPKSYERILEQAREQKSSFATTEQQYLGLDHTILGKRLAQKLQLPSEIILAIWLHHSNAGLITQKMPQARIAQVVELADAIARGLSIGQSGSFDVPIAARQLAESLGLSADDIRQVTDTIAADVEQRAAALDLDQSSPYAAYCDAIRAATVQLAVENTKISSEHTRLETGNKLAEFTRDLLSAGECDLMQLAGRFVSAWQKFLETGPVCLYLAGEGSSATLPAVTIDSDSQKQEVFVTVPEDIPAVPQLLLEKFVIVDARNYVDWLFEQLGVRFELSHTRMVPLQVAGALVGAVVFEVRNSVDSERLAERIRPFAHIGATILHLAEVGRRHQWFAEQLAQLLAAPATAAPVKPTIGDEKLNSAIAEMAAGAAHEMNNPLAVISGRAQLLAGAETDPDKKRDFEQISQNASELSAIIDDLMNYASPPEPRRRPTSVRQILDEATQLAAQKQRVERLDVAVNIGELVRDVLVDSAQVASAIANIISNALESYPQGTGPVRIAADVDRRNDTVKIEISDTGCGMDAETIEKATQPFFSARPAGRKRGMGLAHALRLVQINNGSLAIASRPDHGTTVTVSLPAGH